MSISTLIVDDSVMYRKILTDALSGFDGIVVTGTAANGSIALKKMEATPVDLVLCDVHMPVMDGIETLAAIKKLYPHTIVVMISGISSRSADVTIKALQMGALDFIKKPDGVSPQENMEYLKNTLKYILQLVHIKMNITPDKGKPLIQTVPVTPPAQKKSPSPTVQPKTFSIVAVGVSTGGPEALNVLIPALPANLPVPVVIVQHMPPMFTKSLAESLARKSALRVVEAEEGAAVHAGTVYIAPGGKHMTLSSKPDGVFTAVNDGPPENSCKPAVDVLFRSVADIYAGKGILAVILTGMGSDGLNGVRAMKRKGCFCITQSEKSCVVYGMPRAIDESGLSDLSIPIAEIATELSRKIGTMIL